VHLDILGKGDPRMPALLVDRDRWDWKVRVRKGPDRNGDVLFVPFLDVEECRATSRAESERKSCAFVSHPNELCAIALDGDGVAREARLRAKDAAGSALASVAVADGDTDRFSAYFHPELTATARGKANCHRDSCGVI
jgi:hypothetical protein